MKLRSCFLLVVLFVVVLSSVTMAGYEVTCSVTGDSGNYTYTWDVTNIDQGGGFRQGLDGFFILVPVATNVVSHTVPPNYYPFPDIWVFAEYSGAFVTWQPYTIVDAPPAGYKWLGWWGVGWDTIYPPGATATFSVTLEDDTVPGTTDSAAVTWWGPPQYGGSDTYTSYHYSTTGPTSAPPNQYQWSGFLPPLTAEGKGLFKRGSTIPVKFRICDLEGSVAPDCVATLEVFYWTIESTEGEAQSVSYSNGDTGNTFRYDASDDLYIFNLSTRPWAYLGNMCYQIVVTLDDGQQFDIYFSLK